MANYLYNGVELPEIPKVAGYDYSMIFKFDTGYECRIYKANQGISNPCYYKVTSTAKDSFRYPGTYRYYSLTDSAWVQTESQNETALYSIDSDIYKTPVWTNFTFLYQTFRGEQQILLYASEPVPVREYPIASEVTLSPQSVEVTAGQAQDIQFTLTGTDGTDYTGIATWAYSITDKNGTVSKDDAPWVSWVSAEGGSVLLRITADAPGGHEITVIAAWGTEDDPQSLWAKVTIPVKRVSEQWLYSFQTGLALGLAGKPLPIKKEPVAYLYNGVELPEIPVYDHENPVEGYTDPCPYAVLVSGSDTPYEYDCYLYAAPFYAKDGKITPAKNSMAQCHHYGYVDGVWQYIESWLFSSGTSLTGTAFWTNTDIYMRDDTSVLYLAKSEPIPVYE